MRRVLHITDVHFGRGHLPDRSAGVVRLAQEREPDVVVFSGDLTKRAKPVQFAEARRFVGALGAPTIAVPGNHDVPLFRVWERVFSPYGAFRRHYSDDLEPVWEDDEVRVIGLNTAFGWTFTGGRVKRSQLRRLERRLAGGGGRFTIVAQHHQMIPVPGYGSDEVFRNAGAVARTLIRGGADLVLSGHVHLSYLGDTSTIVAGEEPPLPVLFSGTASCARGRGPEEGRNSLHWIEIGTDSVQVERLEWSDDSSGFESVDTRPLVRRVTPG